MCTHFTQIALDNSKQHLCKNKCKKSLQKELLFLEMLSQVRQTS